MGIINANIIFSISLDEDKVLIPISSFNAYLYDGKPSFISVTIPDYQPYIDEIRAKMDGGTMMLEKSINGDVEEIFWVNIENAELQEVGDDKSLILFGSRIYYNSSPKTVDLTNVEYKRKAKSAAEPALKILRCNIANSFNPGDTVRYDDYEFMASPVIITGSGNRFAIEAKETGTKIWQQFFYPSVSADDYYWYQFGDLTNDDIVIIIGDLIGAYNAGICFKNVTIPQGATILNASITFIVYDSNGEAVKILIYGNDTDNASPPANKSEAEALALTDTYKSWENLPILTEGYQCSTPDISQIVQEIINREGWLSGNALQILLKDNGSDAFNYRQFFTIDAGMNYRPLLSIVWEL